MIVGGIAKERRSTEKTIVFHLLNTVAVVVVVGLVQMLAVNWMTVRLEKNTPR